jgi:subtilisin family serine protease
MALLSVAELRRTVQSDLDDAQLADLITEEEAELVRRFGAHGDGSATVSEVHRGGGCDLFLKRATITVTSVTEATSLGGTGTALIASSYYAWPGQGRLTRLPEGTAWARQVTVVYVPADDRSLRKAVITELVRLRLEQTALQAESVAGEYSYTAPPDWEAVRRRAYRRLTFEGF